MKNNAMVQAMLKSDTPEKDMKHGLALGVAFATLVAFAMPSEAQEPITDDELCDKAVEYSVKYIPEEDGYKLHDARWKILEGKRTDDMQKLVGMVIFEMGQRLGYTYREEEHGPADEWFPDRVEDLRQVCENAVRDMRTPGIESANPDEAW